MLLKAAQRPQQLLVGAARNTPTAAAASLPAARFKMKDVLTPKMHSLPRSPPSARNCLHPHQSRDREATEGIPTREGDREGGRSAPAPLLQRPGARGGRPQPAPGDARPTPRAPDKAWPDSAPRTPPRRRPGNRAMPRAQAMAAGSRPPSGRTLTPSLGPGSPTLTQTLRPGTHACRPSGRAHSRPPSGRAHADALRPSGRAHTHSGRAHSLTPTLRPGTL